MRFLADINVERKYIPDIVDITVYFHTSVQVHKLLQRKSGL